MVVVRGANGSAALTRCVSVFVEALANSVGSMGSHGLLSITGEWVKSCSFNCGKLECCALVGFNGLLPSVFDSVVDCCDLFVVGVCVVVDVVVLGSTVVVVCGSSKVVVVIVVVLDFSVVVCMVFS